MKTSRLLIPIALLSLLFATSCHLTDSNPSPTINVSCDVQELINYMDWANGDPRPITLILEEGCVYELEVEDNLIGRHGDTTGESGANGLPPIEGELTITGEDVLIRRSYAAGTPPFRIFFVASSGNLTLDGLNLENGESLYGGGAIYNDGGVLLIQRSEIINNRADGSGGAILNDGGQTTLHNSTLLDNEANSGGGIHNNTGTVIIEEFSFVNGNEVINDGGGIFNRGSLSISGSRVRNNVAGRAGGGIFSLESTSSITIEETLFENNIANSHGGGIASFETDMTIQSSTFINNQGLRGGAVRARDATVSIQDTVFTGNTSTEYGGAIVSSSTEMTIDLCSFIGNQGTIGGALYHAGLSNTMTITNSSFEDNIANLVSGGAIDNNAVMLLDGCTLYSNEATMGGGGIFNDTNAIVLVTNSTFSANIALNGGGGIFNQGTLEVVHSTFVDNDGARGDAIWSYETGTITVKNIIVGSQDGFYPCDLANLTVEGVFVDSTSSCAGYTTDLDPQLQPLADNGGPTQTHALPANSPVRDLATDCTDLQGNPVLFDQRGVNRPYPPDGNCDPGSFEHELMEPPEPGIDAGIVPNLCAPQNTTCRRGPDQRFAAAGYLLEGECANIVGVSENSEWFVIPNPDWEGECFIAEYLVEVTGPLDNLPIIVGPPLPAESATPIMGCLVRPLAGGDPVCTVPCPDGADPGTPCIP